MSGVLSVVGASHYFLAASNGYTVRPLSFFFHVIPAVITMASSSIGVSPETPLGGNPAEGTISMTRYVLFVRERSLHPARQPSRTFVQYRVLPLLPLRNQTSQMLLKDEEWFSMEENRRLSELDRSLKIRQGESIILTRYFSTYLICWVVSCMLLVLGLFGKIYMKDLPKSVAGTFNIHKEIATSTQGTNSVCLIFKIAIAMHTRTHVNQRFKNNKYCDVCKQAEITGERKIKQLNALAPKKMMEK